MNKEISFPKINIKLDISYTCMMSEMDPIGPRPHPSSEAVTGGRQVNNDRLQARLSAKVPLKLTTERIFNHQAFNPLILHKICMQSGHFQMLCPYIILAQSILTF